MTGLDGLEGLERIGVMGGEGRSWMGGEWF